MVTFLPKYLRSVVSYGRPSTQSQSVGGNRGSGEAVGTLGMVTITTLDYGQSRKLLAFPLVPNRLGRKGRTVRDFWTSLN